MLLVVMGIASAGWGELYTFGGTITGVIVEITGSEPEIDYTMFLGRECKYVFDVEIYEPGYYIDGMGEIIYLTDTENEDYCYANLVEGKMLLDLNQNDLSDQFYGLDCDYEGWISASLFAGSFTHTVVIDNFRYPLISTWQKGMMHFIGSECTVGPDYKVTLTSNNLQYKPDPVPPPEPVPEAPIGKLMLLGGNALVVAAVFRRKRRRTGEIKVR